MRIFLTPLIVLSLVFASSSYGTKSALHPSNEDKACYLHNLPRDVETLIIQKIHNANDLRNLRVCSKREYALVMKRTPASLYVCTIHKSNIEAFIKLISIFASQKKEHRRSSSLELMTPPGNHKAFRGAHSDSISDLALAVDEKDSKNLLKKRKPSHRDEKKKKLKHSFHGLPKPFREIDIKNAKLTEPFIHIISCIPHLKRIRFFSIKVIQPFTSRLKIYRDQLEVEFIDTPISVSQLADLSLGAKFYALALKNNQLAIKRSDSLSPNTYIQALRISQNTLSQALSTLKGFKNIHLLTLSSCGLHDEDLKDLNVFKKLKILCLNHNTHLTMGGLKSILAPLQTLYIVDTGITSKDIPDIVSHFRTLESLKIGHLALNKKDLERAYALRPGLEIIKEIYTISE